MKKTHIGCHLTFLAEVINANVMHNIVFLSMIKRVISGKTD